MDEHRLVYVTEWPRSGGTWLHDCLADSLPGYEVAPGYPACIGRDSNGYFFRVHVPADLDYEGAFPTFTDPYIERDARGCALAYRASIVGATFRVVVLVRDPRDVVVSHYYMACHAGSRNPEDFKLADYIRDILIPAPAIWSLPTCGWKDFYRGWMRADGVVWVRQEDLIEDRLGTVTSLLEMLEFDAAPNAIRWAVKQYSGTHRHTYNREYADGHIAWTAKSPIRGLLLEKALQR